jgi:hypothetical protein
LATGSGRGGAAEGAGRGADGDTGRTPNSEQPAAARHTSAAAAEARILILMVREV